MGENRERHWGSAESDGVTHEHKKEVASLDDTSLLRRNQLSTLPRLPKKQKIGETVKEVSEKNTTTRYSIQRLV